MPMGKPSRRTLATLVVTCLATGVLTASTTLPAAAAPTGAPTTGAPAPGGTAADGRSQAAGHAVVVRGPNNTYSDEYAKVKTWIVTAGHRNRTSVWLLATGFPASAAGRTLGVHVHTKPCGAQPGDAGPHYQNPGAPADTPLHEKEIWLDVKVDDRGVGTSGTVVDWAIRAGDANSVVIHAEPTDHHSGNAGDRLVCTTVPFGS